MNGFMDINMSNLNKTKLKCIYQCSKRFDLVKLSTLKENTMQKN